MTAPRKGLALTLITTLGIIVTVVVLFVYTMTQPRIMNVKDLVRNGAITYEEPVTIEAFQLADHRGEPFTQARFDGHWTLMFFGFSHCGGFCPTTLALLNEFVGQLKPEIAEQTQVVMVSVDPERDTPARLREYMHSFNQDFIGVTGDLTSIKSLAEQLYISFQPHMAHHTENNEEGNYQVAHGEQLVLINPEGDYHGFFKPPFALARLKTTYQSIVITYERKR